MNLPESFIERTTALMGSDDCKALCEALQHDTPVSIRFNRQKTDFVPLHSTNIPWASDGYYIDYRPTFTFDPLFHTGSYYVQEASSMFVERAVRQYVDKPVVALDLCAAPGGKSTLLRSVLPEGSFLVANEVMRNRSQVLAENIIKWGHPETMVTNNDPSDFTSLGEVFDFILTDVPCSGEGMFRKDEVAVEEWSPANVGLCWERQRRILRDIWPCLKPGGILVYSTCTYNREENEDNVAWIAKELGAEVLPVDISEEWNITGNLTGADFPVYRFLPHKTVGEGLFLAVLRKDSDTEGGTENIDIFCSTGKKSGGKKKNNKKEQVTEVPGQLKEWIFDAGDFEFLTDTNSSSSTVTAYCVPKKWSQLVSYLSKSLYVLHKGIYLAEMKGKDWQPHHSLAMSAKVNKYSFPLSDVSYEQAVAYLRKEAITLDSSVPRGYILLTYKDIPLGFVKNIGNRANNLYPQEWRIRSGYLPEEIKTVF